MSNDEFNKVELPAIEQLKKLPKRKIATQSLRNYGLAILTNSKKNCLTLRIKVRSYEISKKGVNSKIHA